MSQKSSEALSLRRSELGAFLRARRAQVTPGQVGLPLDGGARRSPGLRREEIALLAGIGVSWYTWIEQGRATNVSGEVLDAIADVLQLNDAQRRYLRRLGEADLDRPDPVQHPRIDALQPYVENWAPNPAYIVDRCWNVVCANLPARLLLGAEGADHNVLRDFFTNPSVRERHPRWEEEAPGLVARFRAQAADHIADPGLLAMVDGLRRGSSEFARLWDRHEIEEDSCGTSVVAHPRIGELTFNWTMLDFTSRLSLRIKLFLPMAGTGAEAKLLNLADLLRGQPRMSLAPSSAA